MSRRRCGVCSIACRANTRRTVYAVNEKGRLVPRRACVKCAAGAVPVLVASPKADPKLCVVCKLAPAAICEPCNLKSRTAAAREARLAAEAKAPSIRWEQPTKVEPKEDL